MKVFSFGGAVPTNYYTFPQTNSTETWEVLQPQVAMQVAGASGQYDFHPYAGAAASTGGNNPVSPYLITKTFDLVADTYTDLEDARQELLLEVVNKGMWRLHLIDRDDNYYYGHARCVRFVCNDASDGRQVKMPVEISFFVPEGLFYRGDDSVVGTSNGSVGPLENIGNYYTMVDCELEAFTAPITKFVIDRGTYEIVWDDTGGSGVPAGSTLYITSSTYTVTIDGVDAYDKFSIVPQSPYYYSTIPWLYANPDTSSYFSITVTQSGGTFNCTFELESAWRL